MVTAQHMGDRLGLTLSLGIEKTTSFHGLCTLHFRPALQIDGREKTPILTCHIFVHDQKNIYFYYATRIKSTYDYMYSLIFLEALFQCAYGVLPPSELKELMTCLAIRYKV